MSLLLEALKKAEKAKEEAQRRAKGADAPDAPASVFDPETTMLDEAQHVRTRDELPDISAPLEILSDDLRPAAAPKAMHAELSLAEETRTTAPEPKLAARRETARSAPEAQGAAASPERATAQRVFEAKFKEPNPRLPFFITLGVLSMFAIGTVVYFWLQLRPAPALVNANPPRSADEKPVDAAASKPAAVPAAPGSTPAPAAAAIPGLPGGAPAATVAPAAPAAPSTPAPATAAAPVTATTPAAAATAAAPSASAAPAVSAAPAASRRATSAARTRPAPAATSNEERPLSVSRSGPQIHPQVATGYAAYQAGDLPKARADYLQVLREEPGNRDALLGSAAVEMRAQRYDVADRYYQRLLQADPRDAHAQAGMVALRGQQLDPVAVESRVKSLIAADRDANVLYFTLGNQYAQQGRWAEAQQAYFKAFAMDPENPDFAFNLAVSLDQLRQPRLALEHYRRALALAEKRSASFPAETARSRVQQLSR